MKMLQRNPDENFTIEPLGVKKSEVARVLGCSIATVNRLLVSGSLFAVKRGASTLVTLASLRSYEASLPPASFGAHRIATPPSTARNEIAGPEIGTGDGPVSDCVDALRAQ